MKLQLDFNLPDNARIKVSGFTTSLIVSLCVPKEFGKYRFPSQFPRVFRGPRRHIISKELVLVHLNRENVTKSYFRMVRELQIEAREMKKLLLQKEIESIHQLKFNL